MNLEVKYPNETNLVPNSTNFEDIYHFPMSRHFNTDRFYVNIDDLYKTCTENNTFIWGKTIEVVIIQQYVIGIHFLEGGDHKWILCGLPMETKNWNDATQIQKDIDFFPLPMLWIIIRLCVTSGRRVYNEAIKQWTLFYKTFISILEDAKNLNYLQEYYTFLIKNPVPVQ